MITNSCRRYLVIAALSCSAILARAELAVVGTDSKVGHDLQHLIHNGPPDTFAVVDLSASPPRLVAEIPAPTSVVGPPFSVAITPDEKLALDTSCMMIDPANPAKQIPDDRMSVIDLESSPPRVIATLRTGKGPAGISINRQGTVALVANRGDGSISIFTIDGKTVAPAGNFVVGNAASALGTVAFTPDGKRALVSRDGDNLVTLLSVDGTNLSLAGRDIRTGLRPYGLDVSRDGSFAVVGNVGYGSGDSDTVSVIDLGAKPPRAVQSVTVPQTPEGIMLSPDGTLCAVVAQNGSNKGRSSPFHSDHGKLVLLRVVAGRLHHAAEADIGHWSQGAVFSADNKWVLVCNMWEKNLQVFEWDGTTLKDTGQPIPLGGGPVAVRVANR